MPTTLFAALPSHKPSVPLNGPSVPNAGYPGLAPNETKVLKAKTVVKRGGLPLPCDILWERDIACSLRDNTTVYVDIYRPTGEKERYPCLVAWGPYGKHGGGRWAEKHAFGTGVSKSKLSGLQTWQGPDPAFWVNNGYAVANVDPRGICKSGGKVAVLGTQEGQDGYDVVEFLAKQTWCNAQVGLAGTDWLASAQWFIAAERPPSLRAIAPWEGHADWYSAYAISGMLNSSGPVTLKSGPVPITVPNQIIDAHVKRKPSKGRDQDGPLQLHTAAVGFLSGNDVEDVEAMLKQEPLRSTSKAEINSLWQRLGITTVDPAATGYWDDKCARVEHISVPTYAVTSWSSRVNAPGTLRAFSRLPSSTPSWLRVHGGINTADFYKNQDDLLEFFNHYLKPQETVSGSKARSWPDTPKVRLGILDLAAGGWAGKAAILDHAAPSWPLPEAKPLKLYLDSADYRLLPVPTPPHGCSRVYKSDDNKSVVVFYHKFHRDVHLVGLGCLKLFISSTHSDDIDVFVTLERATPDRLGKGSSVVKAPLFSVPLVARVASGTAAQQYFYKGPQGRLRASRRAVDTAPPDGTETAATPSSAASLATQSVIPSLLHTKDEPLRPGGKVAELYIPLDPTALTFRKGDDLVLTLSGFDRRVMPGTEPVKTKNVGIHVIHTGGDRDSSLMLDVLEA